MRGCRRFFDEIKDVSLLIISGFTCLNWIEFFADVE